jgi:hypothetical protein
MGRLSNGSSREEEETEMVTPQEGLDAGLDSISLNPSWPTVFPEALSAERPGSLWEVLSAGDRRLARKWYIADAGPDRT